MKKEITINYFNRIANKYDENEIPEPIRCYPLLINKLPSSFSSILDIGCGTGSMLNMIATNKQDNSIKLMGIDISSEMIAIAKDKSNGEIIFKVDDVEKLDIDDNSFDVVTCMHSFHHYPNPSIAMKEIFRVLEPGGYFYIVDNYRCGICRFFKNIAIALYYRRKMGDIKVYSVDEISRKMQDAGFSIMKHDLLTDKSFIVIGKK